MAFPILPAALLIGSFVAIGAGAAHARKRKRTVPNPDTELMKTWHGVIASFEQTPEGLWTYTLDFLSDMEPVPGDTVIQFEEATKRAKRDIEQWKPTFDYGDTQVDLFFHPDALWVWNAWKPVGVQKIIQKQGTAATPSKAITAAEAYLES